MCFAHNEVQAKTMTSEVYKELEHQDINEPSEPQSKTDNMVTGQMCFILELNADVVDIDIPV